MCMIRFHPGLRSQLNWDPTAGRMTVFAIIEKARPILYITHKELQCIGDSEVPSLKIQIISMSVYASK